MTEPVTGEPVVSSVPVSPVDLDAIEARLAEPRLVSPVLDVLLRRDMPALVAEVKRLRGVVDDVTTENLLDEARDEITDLSAAVERVRALHTERPNDWWGDGDRVTDRWKPTECALCIRPWPCPTIRALDGAT